MKEFLDNYNPLNEDLTYGGQRTYFKPSTTIINDVNTGISSKHCEAAEQMLETIIDHMKKGEEDNAIMLLMADQEFMPYFYSKLFSMLYTTNRDKKTNERLPLLLSLAMGHALKGISISMIAYYQAILDPLFIAQGMKIDSTKYNNIRSGKVICDSIRWYTCATESLRIAYAKKYLEEMKDIDIVLFDREKTTIQATFKNLTPSSTSIIQETDSNKEEDDQLCIDQFGRPHKLEIIKGMREIATNFQQWVEKQAYGPNSLHKTVGPSGYYPMTEDEEQPTERESNDPPPNIEQEYEYLWDKEKMPYYPNGDEDGLLQQVKDAKIFNKDYPRSRDVLVNQYYIYLKYTDLFDYREGCRCARLYQPNDWDMKLPDGTCLIKVIHCGMMFGPEAYSLIAGTQLTRVRLKNKLSNGGSYIRCNKCKRKKENCVCTFKKGEWIIVLKALLVSVFTRRQPNYQRLVLNHLILIASIIQNIWL